MSKETRSLLLHYGAAVLADVLALSLTLLLWPLIEPAITPFFFVAVMVSAWYGGLGPGLLATALAAFASAYFFIPPLHSLDVGWDDLLRLGVYMLVALVVNSLTVKRKRAEEALRSAHDELERRVQDRTMELAKANEALQAEILERKRAEEALRYSEEHFRSLIENASDIITVLQGDGTIRYLSPSTERVLGYNPHTLVGRNALEFVHASDAPYVTNVFTDVIQNPGLTRSVELRVRHRDGSWHILEAIGKNLRDEFGGQNLIVNARDITERKRAEEALYRSQEQLRQSQKMEAVGRLAGGVAHDFNNLLTAIRGYSELLLTSLSPEDPLREDIEEIKKAATRAASLTYQLLVFSRRQVFTSQVLDLNTVVINTEKMLRRLIGEDINLVTRLEPMLGCVKADPGQIEQVILNLAINARDAMPQGGTLIIETANVELDTASARQHIGAQAGSYVMLAVTDTGCGMDAETRSHIFEPFFTTKEQGKGTGLGLSTVYGIVTQNDGHISVYSELGRGTTFKIYLPQVNGVVEAAAEERILSTPLQGLETILVVEDEEAVRRLARRVLRESGYTVLEAHHGSEALLICERYEGPIPLLLTDVVMPGMGGRELAERLRPLRPEMKVLYMSGYADNAIFHHTMLGPDAAFLEKPFTPELLTRKVRAVLDG